MIILTIVGVAALFIVLWLIVNAQDRKENETITFNVPTEIIANHQPTMTLSERERIRRRILNEAFETGFHARWELEQKHKEDQNLANTPYNIKKLKTHFYDQR